MAAVGKPVVKTGLKLAMGEGGSVMQISVLKVGLYYFKFSFVKIMSWFPLIAGFMADKFGNYVAAFLMAGSVGVFGSLFPFVLLCTKRKNNDRQVAYLEELMDKDQEVEKKHNTSRNSNSAKITYHVELEQCNPAGMTVAHSVSSKRPVSFMCAMENPFNFLPPKSECECLFSKYSKTNGNSK